MTDLYLIRLALPGDCVGIARLQVASYRSAYAGLLPADFLAKFSVEEQEQDWQEWSANHPQDILAVAETPAGEVAGYALARPGLADILPYDSELLALHVRAAAQRQGVGYRLVAYVAGQLRQQGCQKMLLWVLSGNPARGFYERLGGRWLAERTVELDEGVLASEVAYGWENINSLLEV